MDKKLGSNVVQFPLRGRRGPSVDALSHAVAAVLEATESSPPVKVVARRGSVRVAQQIRGDDNVQVRSKADVGQTISGNGNTQIAADSPIYVSGSGNVVAGRDVLHMHKAPSIRNIIQPGPEHIDADQRRQLHDLCDEWVTLHASIKKTKLTKAKAWVDINRAAGSTTYALILQARFDDARAFVMKQMAILRAMKSAPRKDDSWRAKRIGAIKARCINQLGDAGAYRQYIQRNFGVVSLTELATDQLQKTYAYIMAKKA